MILEVQERNVRTEGMGTPVPFGIDKEEFGFITGILSNKLYSDKQAAIIREYIANAVDANRNANPKRPIQITPPTEFDTTFKVRDFGFGLTRNEIESVYIKFGKSTKRDSNLDIGTFGLGCKSAFAYTDSFVITSWNAGICATYSAQKGRDGRLFLYPVGETESSEPSGIEISIAINANDLGSFNKKLGEFCKYLDEKPEIIGTLDIPKLTHVCDFGDSFITDNDSYGNSNTPKVLMGSIVYPIDKQHLMEAYRYFTNIIFRMKLGDVDIAPDREKLEYTAKTIDALNNRFFDVVKKIKGNLQKDIDTKTYPWEALGALYSVNKATNTHLDPSDFTFKGRKLESIKHDDMDDFPQILEESYRRRSRKWRSCHSIPSRDKITATTVLIQAHQSTKINSSRFITDYTTRFGFTPTCVIVSDNQIVFDKLFCAYWKPEQIVKNAKDVYIKGPRASTGTRSPSKIYVYEDGNTSSRRYRYTLTSVSSGFYLVIKGQDNEYVNPNAYEYRYAARSFGVDFYSIKERYVKHLDSSKWIPLEKKIDELINAKIAKFNVEAYLITKHFQEIPSVCHMDAFLHDAKDFLSAKEVEAVKIYQDFSAKKTISGLGEMNSVVSVAEKMGKKIQIVETPEFLAKLKKVKEFCAKYEFFLSWYGSSGWRMEECRKSLRKFFKSLV